MTLPFLVTLALSPVILIFTAPTLLLRSAVRHRWGVWAFLAVGGLVGSLYLFVIEIAGEYMLSEEPQFRFNGWAWYLRHVPWYSFSGAVAGAVWWWIEKSLADD